MKNINISHPYNKRNEVTQNAKIKTLRLHAYTHAILANMCKKNQPFEDLIKKMIAVYVQSQKQKVQQ